MPTELFEVKEESKNVAQQIVLIKPTNAPLSKEQQAFNKFTRRIEKLQKQIEDETKKMEELNALYLKEIVPLINDLGFLKIQLCHLLDKKRATIKLSNIQNEKLNDLIYDFLDDAFSVIKPDDITKELYKKYSTTNYDEEIENRESEMKEEFSRMFREQFGVEIDPSKLSENFDFGEIEEKIKQQEEQKNGRKKSRNQKQLQKEEINRQKENLKTKSIRSIYIALAKILHPDTESEEALKKEKEEMMKKVTEAYNNKDLLQLLQLEIKWINKHDNKLASLDAPTLNVYVQLLKDQAKELEKELVAINLNPTFSMFANEYQYQTVKAASQNIINEGNRRKLFNEKLLSDINLLEQTSKTYSVIIQCIKDYYTESGNEPLDMDFLDSLSEILIRKHNRY